MKRLHIILFLILIILSGCKIQGPGNTAADIDEVDLLVTRDFGNTVIYQGKVSLRDGESVYSVLSRTLKVEMQYGGSFVKAIENIASDSKNGKQYDWFFYINGIAANQGVKSYKPEAGDRIFFDYHEWNSRIFTPAIIGAFPEPFINGFSGKTDSIDILCSETSRVTANKFGEYLKKLGAVNVRINALDNNIIINRKNPVLLIGTLKELSTLKAYKEICDREEKAGLFVRLSEERIQLLNVQGKEYGSFNKDAGIIVSTAYGLGDTAPLWIAAGIESRDVDNVLNILMDSPEKIKGYYGAAVVNDRLIRLPMTM